MVRAAREASKRVWLQLSLCQKVLSKESMFICRKDISVEVKRAGEALIGDIKSEHFAFLLQLSILFRQLQLMWLCKVVSLGATWLNFPQNMMPFLLIRIPGAF